MQNQNLLSQSLLRITAESMIAQIGIKKAVLKNAPRAGRTLQIDLTVENDGKWQADDPSVVMTPHTFVQNDFVDEAWPWERQKKLECLLQQPESGRTAIYPGTANAPGGIIIDKKEIDSEVVRGVKSIEISICYAYRTFSRLRHTGACF